MTDQELLDLATEFTLIHADRRRPVGHVTELRVAYRGQHAWAIVDSRFNLNHEGDWEYEPSPSERDADFFARCRWPSAREAIAFVEEHLRKHPTGYR